MTDLQLKDIRLKVSRVIANSLISNRTFIDSEGTSTELDGFIILNNGSISPLFINKPFSLYTLFIDELNVRSTSLCLNGIMINPITNLENAITRYNSKVSKEFGNSDHIITDYKVF